MQSEENIGLQFLASGLSISDEIWRILCEIQWISDEIHPKPYKSKCFNQNYSVWWMQERGYDTGFHEILGHSSLPAPPKLKSFCWNIWFYKVLGRFHMKSAGFQNMSFCVMTKYRSFFRDQLMHTERHLISNKVKSSYETFSWPSLRFYFD